MVYNDEHLKQLPRTGRIGRLVKILEAKIDKDSVLKILEDASKYESYSAQAKSEWWKKTVERMENLLGKEKTAGIMRECGSKCCGKGQRETARRLYLESGSLQKFLDRISKHDVRDGDLSYCLINESTIIAEHNKCFCQQVANSKEHFNNLIYCQCSVEFNKQFFTAALGREVQVELLQSIICGAKSCKFKITI